jgi:hypothetical protein
MSSTFIGPDWKMGVIVGVCVDVGSDVSVGVGVEVDVFVGVAVSVAVGVIVFVEVGWGMKVGLDCSANRQAWIVSTEIMIPMVNIAFFMKPADKVLLVKDSSIP